MNISYKRLLHYTSSFRIVYFPPNVDLASPQDLQDQIALICQTRVGKPETMEQKARHKHKSGSH